MGDDRACGDSGALRGGRMDAVKWKQFLKKDNIIIFILAGVLLFIIAMPTQKTESQSGQNLFSAAKESASAIGNGGTGKEASSSHDIEDSFGTDQEQAYVRGLEEQLKDALEDVAGVGKVTIMITLQSSKELVVEKEEPVSRSSTTETDSKGGSRNVQSSEFQQKVVYVTKSGDSEPYVVKTYAPRIEGILVVAQGAGTGTVNSTISEIVQALFGVEPHKIKVVKMGS